MTVIDRDRPAPGRRRIGDRADAISQSIHRAISEQRLLPGTKLPEDQLGGIFGASRTLVRAALQSLAREGVVVLARNKGAAVASPSVAEAQAVFEARRLIEAATVARAAAAATPAALDGLEALLDEGRAALARHDRGRAIRLSGEFHLGISRLAGQPVLHEFLRDLVSRSSLVIALYGHAGHSECGDGDHRALVATLRARDAAMATAEMLRHLDDIERDLDFARPTQRPRALADILEPAPARDVTAA